MKRVVAIAASLAVAAGFSFAAEKAVHPAEAKGTSAPKEQVARPDRGAVRAAMNEIYKEVGLSDEDIAKLKELDAQFKEARDAKDQAKLKQLREERQKIITPEIQEKLREAMAKRGTRVRDSRTSRPRAWK